MNIRFANCKSELVRLTLDCDTFQCVTFRFIDEVVANNLTIMFPFCTFVPNCEFSEGTDFEEI